MFFNIINNIKLSLKYKKKIIRTTINKNELNLIKILIKLNIIKMIKKNKSNYDLILNNNYILKNIKNLYKPGCKYSISYKELKKISLKKKWLLILSTNKGIITNFECVKKKTSGILIMKLYF